jgi:hypothetical protein
MPPPHNLPDDLGPRPTPGAVFAAEYHLGDRVYLKLRDNDLPGFVTSVTFRPGAEPVYGVSWGDGEDSGHYGLELCREFSPNV